MVTVLNQIEKKSEGLDPLYKRKRKFYLEEVCRDIITLCLSHLKLLDRITFCFFVSCQATNLSSNGSLPQDGREPRENRVRSMATQLLAKFESTPSYTVRNSQVKRKKRKERKGKEAPFQHLQMVCAHQSVVQ